VWQGTADLTVSPANADKLVEQWLALHDLDPRAGEADQVDGHARRVWRTADGREVVETFSIAGMAHGTPVHPARESGGGKSGPYMLDVGIASTYHIARFWGLLGSEPLAPPKAAPRPAAAATPASAAARPIRRATVIPAAEPTPAAEPAFSVEAVIESALRAAGLRR
jgi:hypothetical protein